MRTNVNVIVACQKMVSRQATIDLDRTRSAAIVVDAAAANDNLDGDFRQ